MALREQPAAAESHGRLRAAPGPADLAGGALADADDRYALPLLRAQAALFGRLESLAARQRELVTSDEAEALLVVLNDRQALAAELAGVVRRFEPMRRDWRTVRSRLSDVDRAEADGLLTGIRDQLRRVMDGDERDVRLLSARKVMTAAGLRAAVGAGEAVSAYATPQPRTAPRCEFEAE